MSDVTCEVRRNPDGSIDEVVLYADGSCVAHLEQMNESEWMLNFYHGQRRKKRFPLHGVALLHTDETRLWVSSRNGKAWVDVKEADYLEGVTDWEDKKGDKP